MHVPPPVATTIPTPPRAPVRTHPVALVGAGPGDPELLTLKAVRLIRAATVVLVDDLVGEQVLAHVLEPTSPAPRVVRVGKRGGGPATPQAFIARLMVREALAGERVVRLKGGDPLVFGRAGEEVAALRAAGLEVEVVNGITAGLAAVNALGTGWTDRRWAQGVMLVTGHAQDGQPGVDWSAIGAAAASGLTLVVYMGVATAPHWVDALLAQLPPGWPAAVVQAVTTPGERVALTPLADLPALLQSGGFASPAVVVIGRVLLDSPLALADGRAATIDASIDVTISGNINATLNATLSAAVHAAVSAGVSAAFSTSVGVGRDTGRAHSGAVPGATGTCTSAAVARGTV